jgi:hypothetical protein
MALNHNHKESNMGSPGIEVIGKKLIKQWVRRDSWHLSRATMKLGIKNISG